MIHCGQAKGGEPEDRCGQFQCVLEACAKPDGAPGVWRHGRGSDYRRLKAFPTLLSRRHSLRPTRMTPTRSWSPTTTPEASTPTRSTFSGASVSTDGGTHLYPPHQGSGQSPFDNTFGDPVVLYNKPTQTWFTVWLDGNAGCTLGGYKSTDSRRTQIAGPIFAFTRAAATTANLAGQTTTRALPSSGTCIFPGTTLTWVQALLVVSRSTDNGSTWSSAITVANTGTFIRNTQITGDMSGNGTSTSPVWTKAVVVSPTTTPI